MGEGSEVNSTKAVKPTEMSPSTPAPPPRIQRQAAAEEGDGRGPAPHVGQHPEQQGTPWAPHTAEMRALQRQQAVGVGGHRTATVKSLSTKAQVRQRNDSSSSRNWLWWRAAGRRHHAEATEMGPTGSAPQQQGGGEGTQDQ